MKSRPSLALMEPTKPIPAPPARGRLLFVPDVVELLGRRKSAWWIRHRFAPELRMKVGRDVAWYEADAHTWLDSLRGSVR